MKIVASDFLFCTETVFRLRAIQKINQERRKRARTLPDKKSGGFRATEKAALIFIRFCTETEFPACQKWNIFVQYRNNFYRAIYDNKE